MAKSKARTTKPAAPNTDPSPEAWRRLYKLSALVRALEPWRFMNELDVFAFQREPDVEPVFVSVMGQAGEYHAVALYPSVKAYSLLQLAAQSGDPEIAMDLAMGTHQLHLAFGGRADLEARDKKVLKELDLEFKGPVAWPQPRGRRPGHFEWFVDAREAELLSIGLEQLLDVAPRFRKDATLLQLPGDACLVRVPAVGGGAAWRDTTRKIPLKPAGFRTPAPHPECMDRIRNLPPSGLRLELDVFQMAARIGKRGEPSLMGFLLLAVDAASGMILLGEPLTAQPTWEDMWAGVVPKLFSLFEKLSVRPARVAVTSPRLIRLLEEAVTDAGIDLELAPRLKTLASVRRDLEKNGF